jgi:hypothetical protein
MNLWSHAWLVAELSGSCPSELYFGGDAFVDFKIVVKRWRMCREYLGFPPRLREGVEAERIASP